MVLSMDNSCSLDPDGIIAEIKIQSEIAECTWADGEIKCQIKHKELQSLAGKHGVDFCMQSEISKMNHTMRC